MRKALLTMALITATMAWAQDDDMYFVPSKKKAKTEDKQESVYVPRQTIVTTPITSTSVITRDVDEYNRRGTNVTYNYNVSGDTLYIDSEESITQAFQDGYSAGYYDGADDMDMTLSRRLLRYRRPGLVWYDDLYWDTWYDPFFHSPFYYNRWYYDIWGWNYGWGGYWHSPYYAWHHPYPGIYHPHHPGGGWHPGHSIGKPGNSGVAVRNGRVRPSSGRYNTGRPVRDERASAGRNTGRNVSTNRDAAGSNRNSSMQSVRSQRSSSSSQNSSYSRSQRSSSSQSGSSASSPSRSSSSSTRSSGGSFGGSRSGGMSGGGHSGGGSRGGRGGR